MPPKKKGKRIIDDDDDQLPEDGEDEVVSISDGEKPAPKINPKKQALLDIRAKRDAEKARADANPRPKKKLKRAEPPNKLGKNQYDPGDVKP